jgi:single-stranded-DNA-specific exonuclease
MISVSGKKWIEQTVDKRLVEKIKQDHNFSEIVSKLIVSRNYDDVEINNIKNYLKLNNIFSKNNDFDKATNLLISCIHKKEKICILGDYDVDGVSSTALLSRFLNHINQDYFHYIPDRIIDGYGASTKLFEKLILQSPKLVIMLDCGSTSNKAINFLNSHNIKSIVIDHHEINKPYPKSNVIINPKKNINDKYDYFCATTLTYFFVDVLIKKTRSNFNLSDYLIYVLLATVCDVMPLRKINKIIALNVLNDFHLNKNFVFKTIFDQLGIERNFTINDLGFIVGPIINAGGRLGNSSLGVKLLLSDDKKEIKKISYKLIELNEKRKKIEKKSLNEIDYKKIYKENKDVIIYHNNNLSEGLIGIIAARLKDHFNKPTIVLTKSFKTLKASARSTSNYNIGSTINSQINKKIIDNGGGHNMAAGFSIKKTNLKVLDDFIQKDYQKKNENFIQLFKYDAEISISAINLNFYNEINKIGPFGNGNLTPLFLIKNIYVIKSNLINDIHVSSIIKTNFGRSLKSICFNCHNNEIGDYLLSYKKKINILAEITKNTWNNKNNIQLNIKDIILPINSA